MQLTIILPRYHEPVTLYKMAIERFNSFLKFKKIKPKFIIAQNGSVVRYPELENLPNTLYLQTEDKGLGYGYRLAFPHVASDYMYITSAEIPFCFSDLNKMLELLSKYDVIVGSKLHPMSTYKAPMIRKFLSFCSMMTQRLLLVDFPVRDANGSLFCNKKVLKIIDNCIAYEFFITPELVYRAYKAGFQVTEVPVTYEVDKNMNSSVRLFNTSLNNVKHIVKLLREFYFDKKSSSYFK